jgi:hypothetical protein
VTSYNTFPQSDYLRWSEYLSVEYGVKTYRFRAAGYWRLSEYPGYISALAKVSDRLVAMKRKATWIVSGTTNPDLPIQREGVFSGVGCIHAKAKDYFENDLLVIGENDIYRISPSGPAPLLNGDEWNIVREAMFERGADWVEDQADYNVPFLRVDELTKRMYVYVQKGIIHVFDFVTSQWTKFQITDVDGVVNEIGSIEVFDGKVWLWTSLNGIGYFDSATTLDSDRGPSPTYTITTNDVEYYYDLPVVELSGPKRDICIESLDLHHQITTVNPSLTVEISRDGGNTFPQTNTVTLTESPSSSVTKTDRIDIWQQSDSMRIRIGNTGECGPANFSTTGASLAIQVLSDDDNMEYPVPSTSSNL